MVRLNAWWMLVAVLMAGCSSAPTGPTQPDPRPAPGIPDADSGAVVSPPGPERSLTLALLDQANAARLHGDHDAAIATLERAIRIDPGAAELWLLLSQINLEAGDAEAAEQLARKALQFAGKRAHLEQQAWSLIDAAKRQTAERDAYGRDAAGPEAVERE